MKLRANPSLLTVLLAMLLPGAVCAIPPSDVDKAVPPVQPAQPAVAPILVDAIFNNNLFDPKRRPWQGIIVKEDKIMPEPAPAITEQDVQVYGVIVVGGYKRAIVKLGGQFAGLMTPSSPEAPGKKVITQKKKNPDQQPSRQYVILTEGQALGSYVLTSITNSGLTFSQARGSTTSVVAFNKKNDRQQIPNPPAPMTNFPMNPSMGGFQPNQPSGGLMPPAFGGPPGMPPASNPNVTTPDSAGSPPPGFTGADSATNSFPAATAAAPPSPEIVHPHIPPGSSFLESIQRYRDANGGQIPSGGPNPLQQMLKDRAAAGQRP